MLGICQKFTKIHEVRKIKTTLVELNYKIIKIS